MRDFEEFLGGDPVPVDADHWFATGDVGRIDDGILFVTGRVREKIIVGGFNVYPAEVEDAARRSALVEDAVVVGLPDERLGERPVAGIVWAGEPDEPSLLRSCEAARALQGSPGSLPARRGAAHSSREGRPGPRHHAGRGRARCHKMSSRAERGI